VRAPWLSGCLCFYSILGRPQEPLSVRTVAAGLFWNRCRHKSVLAVRGRKVPRHTFPVADSGIAPARPRSGRRILISRVLPKWRLTGFAVCLDHQYEGAMNLHGGGRPRSLLLRRVMSRDEVDRLVRARSGLGTASQGPDVGRLMGSPASLVNGWGAHT
jgi:hypothetical protein